MLLCIVTITEAYSARVYLTTYTGARNASVHSKRFAVTAVRIDTAAAAAVQP
jgi:hypothetical protein